MSFLASDDILEAPGAPGNVSQMIPRPRPGRCADSWPEALRYQDSPRVVCKR
jgi:hypothetical protein